MRSTRVGDAANTRKCLDGNESLRITKIKFETLEGSVKKEKNGWDQTKEGRIQSLGG